jgi:hypothetical protein
MGRDRRRAATGRGSRWSRKLHSLERLEPRCVLNGSAPWIAPSAPTPVKHADVVASGFVSGPSSDLVSRLGELNQYANQGKVGSPFLDGRNVRSLTPNVDDYGSKSGSVSAYNSSVVDGTMTWSPTRSPIVEVVTATPQYVVTSFLDTQTGKGISFLEHVGEKSSPIGGPTKGPSSNYNATASHSEPPNDNYTTRTPTDNSSQNASHSENDPAGPTPGDGSANYGSPATTAVSTPSVASAAQSQSSLDTATAGQAARSVALDSSAAGQFSSAALALVRNADSLSGVAAGQSVLTFNVDVPSAGDQPPIGSRATTGPSTRSTAVLPLARVLPQGGIVQLPDGKAALADMPLDIRRMEQALETVVSEVKLIGPEVARWLDGIHVTPLTVAIAAAAVASGSVYYLRRRSKRRADRPEEEASSSWLFARLQPTPE